MSRNRLLCVLAISAMAITTALAQQPPGKKETVAEIFPGVGQIPNRLPKLGLLTFEEVQAELEVHGRPEEAAGGDPRKDDGTGPAENPGAAQE